MNVMLPGHLRGGMTQQGLHRAEGSPRSIQQARRGVAQPVPIETPSVRASGSRSQLPIEQVPTTKYSSRRRGEDQRSATSLLLQTKNLNPIGEIGTTRRLRFVLGVSNCLSYTVCRTRNVPAVRSTSHQRRASISPIRNPVRTINAAIERDGSGRAETSDHPKKPSVAPRNEYDEAGGLFDDILPNQFIHLRSIEHGPKSGSKVTGEEHPQKRTECGF